MGPNFLCFGILKHKKGSKFVSEERRHTKHNSVNGEGGGRIARSSGRVVTEKIRDPLYTAFLKIFTKKKIMLKGRTDLP